MTETDFEFNEWGPAGLVGQLGWLEVELGVPPLSECDDLPGCLGGTRFYAPGEDSPDLVLTCLWYRRGVRVQAVNGSPILWPGTEKAPRWEAWLTPGVLPPPLRNWGRVRESALAAASCEGEPVIGGTYCCHSLYSAREGVTAVWAWPDRHRHRPQWRLIDAYEWLRLAAWVSSWLFRHRRPLYRV